MKGINTIIALIFIIVIIVAMCVLFYTFVVGFFNAFQTNKTTVSEIVPTETNESLGVIKDFEITPQTFWSSMYCTVTFDDGHKIFIEENYPCNSLETGKELVKICPVHPWLFSSCSYELRSVS
jgi:hypothetical protein